MAKRRAESPVEVLAGLLLGTLFLFILDPVIGQMFNSALANPAFASSSAAPIWRALAAVFDFHLDIILAWIAAIIGLAK